MLSKVSYDFEENRLFSLRFFQAIMSARVTSNYDLKQKKTIHDTMEFTA
jgi:hypothetical protein